MSDVRLGKFVTSSMMNGVSKPAVWSQAIEMGDDQGLFNGKLSVSQGKYITFMRVESDRKLVGTVVIVGNTDQGIRAIELKP